MQQERAGGTRRRIAVVVAAIALFAVVFASVAVANNLDRRTATDVAKQVAKKDCRQTSGCTDWAVRGLHRVSRHKWIGKIAVWSVKNHEEFLCVRQLVIKLDHFSGVINYGVSPRKCTHLGPA